MVGIRDEDNVVEDNKEDASLVDSGFKYNCHIGRTFKAGLVDNKDYIGYH